MGKMVEGNSGKRMGEGGQRSYSTSSAKPRGTVHIEISNNTVQSRDPDLQGAASRAKYRLHSESFGVRFHLVY